MGIARDIFAILITILAVTFLKERYVNQLVSWLFEVQLRNRAWQFYQLPIGTVRELNFTGTNLDYASLFNRMANREMMARLIMSDYDAQAY